MNEIKNIVYTSDICDDSIFKKFNCKKIQVIDTRSAVYMATGIAAQKKEIVLVCINSSNSSRSAFSGMTESFYRNLPIILVTIGEELNYCKELNDVIENHFVVDSLEEIYGFINYKMPMHIEVKTKKIENPKCNTTLFSYLKETLGIQSYLYISPNVSINENIAEFKCKVVQGGMANCTDGALANVLGASLAKIRRRYIGVITETEFIHDMNSLGNININDSLLYIVLCNQKNKLIYSYAKSLGFECTQLYSGKVSKKSIISIVNNEKKSLIIFYGD